MICFIYNAETEYEFENNDLSLEEALKEFYDLSDEEGSFFGIRTHKDEVLQFAWDDIDKWLIDVPYDMENRLTLQKYVNYEECIEIIKLIYAGVSPKDIKGLEKVSI